MTTEITITAIHVLGDGRNPRRRQRTVSDLRIGDIVTAPSGGGCRMSVTHGGTVANCYGYRAYTQYRVYIVDAAGRAVVSYGEIAANKATACGAVAASDMAACADLVDDRVTREPRIVAARHAMRRLHAEAYDPIVVSQIRLGADSATVDALVQAVA